MFRCLASCSLSESESSSFFSSLGEAAAGSELVAFDCEVSAALFVWMNSSILTLAECSFFFWRLTSACVVFFLSSMFSCLRLLTTSPSTYSLRVRVSVYWIFSLNSASFGRRARSSVRSLSACSTRDRSFGSSAFSFSRRIFLYLRCRGSSGS